MRPLRLASVQAAVERRTWPRGGNCSTAELTWALILALLRPVQRDDQHIRDGGWQRQLGGDLAGRTLGPVGLGRQGGRVARVARAFDMNVIAWSPHLTPERAAEHGAVRVSKHDVFARADIASVHLVLGDHWLRTAPRTLLSPHMGYVSGNGYRVFYADAAEDIAAYLRGEPVRTL